MATTGFARPMISAFSRFRQVRFLVSDCEIAPAGAQKQRATTKNGANCPVYNAEPRLNSMHQARFWILIVAKDVVEHQGVRFFALAPEYHQYNDFELAE